MSSLSSITVLLNQHVVVVRVCPDAWTMVAVDPVAADIGAVNGPELHGARTAAIRHLGLDIIGVVASEFVVHSCRW